MTTVDHSIQHPGSKTKGDDSFVRFHLGKNKGIGWGVMRCEATRKIIKATFRASNGKMVVLALSRLGLTRNSQQRSECGSREQRWPTISINLSTLTGPTQMFRIPWAAAITQHLDACMFCSIYIEHVFWLGKYFPRCLCHTFWFLSAWHHHMARLAS